MMNNDGSQFLVLHLKHRWFFVLLTILFFLGVILYLWSEVLYLMAGEPGNLVASNTFYNWFWGSPDGLKESQFTYRLICRFPFMILCCIYGFLDSFYNSFFTKLRIGQQCIEYYTVGYFIKAGWSDIEKFGEDRYGFRQKRRRLVFFLKSGSYKKKWQWIPFGSNSSIKDYIPLSDFGIDIAGVEALKLINQNAPDLGIFDH